MEEAPRAWWMGWLGAVGIPAAVALVLLLLLRYGLEWPPLVVGPLVVLAAGGTLQLVEPRLRDVRHTSQLRALAAETAIVVFWPLLMMAVVGWACGLVGVLPLLRWPLVVAAGLVAFVAWREGLFPEAQPSTFLRGRRVVPLAEAKEELAAARSRSKAGEAGQPRWGEVLLPVEAATTHFAAVGTTGSGKTTTILILAGSVLPLIGKGLGHRAVFYDQKQEFLPVLHGLRLKVPVISLNPFECRGYAWDLCVDVDSPAVTAQIAALLVAQPGSGEPQEAHGQFFNHAVRDVVEGVILAFKALGVHWTLRDLCLAARDPDRLERLLATNADTSARLMYFGDDQLQANVMASLRARMHLYDPVAAAWSRTGRRRVSLRRWVEKGEQILILANDREISEALTTINRAIFSRLSQLLLSQTAPYGRSWVFVDELRAAQHLDGLPALLTEGRSNGVCCVLGFQDIEGLSDSFNERVAHEMLGQCKNQAFLNLINSGTAKWASDMIGTAEIKERQESTGPRGEKSVSEHIQERPAVMPAQLTALKTLEVAGKLDGWFSTSYSGVFRQTIDSATLRRLTPQAHPRVVRLKRRPASDQYLEEWSPEELARLGLADSESPHETRHEAPKGDPPPHKPASECGQEPVRQLEVPPSTPDTAAAPEAVPPPPAKRPFRGRPLQGTEEPLE